MPVRVEVGPRDLAEGNVTIVRRDAGTKDTVPASELAGRVAEALRDAQRALLEEATALRDSRTVDATTLSEAADAATQQVGPAQSPHNQRDAADHVAHPVDAHQISAARHQRCMSNFQTFGARE